MQLQQHREQLESLNIWIAGVTFETESVAQNYCQTVGWESTFLIDTERTLFHAYGMEQGKWWDLAGPAVVWKSLKLLGKGRKLHKVTGDVRQLGGNVIVDPHGILRWVKVGQGSADRPEIETLINVVADHSPTES